MFRNILFACAITLGLNSQLYAQEQSLPLQDGAYLRNPEWCEKYFRNDLDFIDFEVEQNGRSFAFIDSGCLVHSVEQVRERRFFVQSDCHGYGERSQVTMMLDVYPNNSIRIDGGELHQFCQRTNVPSKTLQSTSSDTDLKALISQWADANEGCRGGHGDDPATDRACEQRWEFKEKLGQLGYCYANFDWNPCK